MAAQNQKIPVTLIPGDGIGPEVTEATLAVLEAVGAPLEYDTQKAGMAGVAAAGDPLPKATLESIRRTRLALKGPLATPVGGGPVVGESWVWGMICLKRVGVDQNSWATAPPVFS